MISERAQAAVRTRADRVRERRARLKRPIEPAARTIRDKQPRRKRIPRKRRDVRLSVTPGAEMQLPTLPTVHVGPRLLSAAVLLLLAWGLGEIVSGAGFLVESVEVSGNRLLTAAQVDSVVSLVGQAIFTVDPEQVTQQLIGHPEIMTAEVHVVWPNVVKVSVEERRPALAWNDAGRTWWLSEDGVAFIPHGSPADLVTVRSDEPVLNVNEEALAPVIAPQLIQNVIALSREMDEVGVLRYDRRHGLGFEHPQGWMIYFGEDGDMAMKVRVYRALAQRLEENGIRPTLVSLENQAAPYYQLER